MGELSIVKPFELGGPKLSTPLEKLGYRRVGLQLPTQLEGLGAIDSNSLEVLLSGPEGLEELGVAVSRDDLEELEQLEEPRDL